MVCEKCGKEHDGSFGSGRFCSSYCARSYSTQKNRKAINLSISQSIKSSEKFKANIERKRGKNNVVLYGQQKAEEIKLKQQSKFKKKMGADYPFVYGSDNGTIRIKLLQENQKCQGCGICTWQDSYIDLELHHIDGDNQNNVRQNVQLLCPNCHSQTDNFRHKNVKKKVAESDLVEAIKANKLNLRQALLSVGLSAKGKNYERCHMLITKYKLDMEP